MRGHITRSLSSSEIYPRIKLGLRHRENSSLSLATIVGNNKSDAITVGKRSAFNDNNKVITENKQHFPEILPLPKELISSRKWVNSSFHHMRWVVVSLIGICMFLTFFSRLSITVAIIDMVNQTHVPVHYQYPNHTNTSVIDQFEIVLEDEVFIYDWDNTVQMFLVMVYMFAYGLPQVPLSMYIEKNGGHKITAYAQIVALLTTASIPSVAHYGWGWVALMRIILGISHSGSLAVGVHMIDVWLPNSEKSLGVTLFQFISNAGVVFNPVMSGYLTSINWTYAFYGPSLLVSIWVIIWLVTVTNNPKDCWLISQQELQMVLNNNNYRKQVENSNDCGDKKEDVFPWRQVFKTPCIYAFLFIWVTQCITVTGFITILPRFLMANGIGVDDIAENGLTTFYIQSGALVSYVWATIILAYLSEKNVAIINARRAVLTLSIGISAISWILPSFIGGSPVWMCLLNRAAQPITDIIVLSSVMDNFSEAGISASIFGIMNTVGSCANLPTGIIFGRVLDIYGESLTCWHLILSSMSLMITMALICYYIFIDSLPFKLDDSKYALSDIEENIVEKSSSAKLQYPTLEKKGLDNVETVKVLEVINKRVEQ